MHTASSGASNLPLLDPLLKRPYHLDTASSGASAKLSNFAFPEAPMNKNSYR